MVRSNIDGYTARFHKLERLVPHMVTPESQRVNRYIQGLAPEIKPHVTSSEHATIQGAMSMANCLTIDGIKDGLFKKKENEQGQGQCQYAGQHLKYAKCNFHHSGKANVVADALSRKERMKPRRARAMSMTIHSSIKARILEAQIEASKGANTLAEMLKGLDKQFERKEDGGLYVAERIWVPIYEHQKPLGLLQQLEIPEWKWENITIDFITKLPRTRSGHDSIWVIIDRLAKSAHFLAVREDFKTKNLARLYINKIVKALGTRLDLSTAYHPKTDGQSERTIQTLEDMLRAYAIDFGGNWDTHLPLLEFSYNNSYHSSVKCAHFEALPFEIVERVGPVAYRLRLPQELVGVHDTFHVSNLKKCMADVNLHVPLEEVKIDDKLHFADEPMEIMDHESDDQERVVDEGFSDVEEANNDDDQEITEIFKIETNLFDYETPLCTEFKEFNFLIKVDPELFSHDIERTTTYEYYENELNDELKEPWSEDGVPYEMCDYVCEPFRFKNGKAKWPTCNSNEDGICNGGELSGMVWVGYMTYFQDYEWYNELADGNLKKEALRKKLFMKDRRLQDYWWKVNDHECSPFCNWRDHIRGPYANLFTTYDPHFDINSIFGMNNNARNMSNVQDEERNERYNLFNDTSYNVPVCKIIIFEMSKYSFGQDEEYVAIKESEYDDLTKTNEDACRAYQEIFRSIDEGWVVIRAE
nr:putative reverse transcriptase domain-containing protein [Tanacetum cinerariifolium]